MRINKTKRKIRRKTMAKNSLVANIRKRQNAGKSRTKKNSTVSKKSYSAMKKNWKKSG